MVTDERARVARAGWGAQLLAAQGADGRWGGGTFMPRGIGTFDTLHLLWRLGIEPESAEARRAIALVHEAARWDYDPDLRFWEGEVEPCINGRVVGIGAYFGQDVRGIVDRLLTEQMADGGWELRAGDRLGPRLVRHDDQRARGATRVRASHGLER